MERILASLMKDVMQKKEVQWEQVRRIIAATENTLLAERDRCMIM